MATRCKQSKFLAYTHLEYKYDGLNTTHETDAKLLSQTELPRERRHSQASWRPSHTCRRQRVVALCVAFINREKSIPHRENLHYDYEHYHRKKRQTKTGYREYLISHLKKKNTRKSPCTFSQLYRHILQTVDVTLILTISAP